MGWERGLRGTRPRGRREASVCILIIPAACSPASLRTILISPHFIDYLYVNTGHNILKPIVSFQYSLSQIPRRPCVAVGEGQKRVQ